MTPAQKAFVDYITNKGIDANNIAVDGTDEFEYSSFAPGGGLRTYVDGAVAKTLVPWPTEIRNDPEFHRVYVEFRAERDWIDAKYPSAA